MGDKKGGIYRILNIKNNKQYIGSTRNFDRRKKEHFNSLKSQNHWNYYLQSSFNKYGIDAFIFQIIEECNEDQLLEKEQVYLDQIFLFGSLDRNIEYYNIAKDAKAPMKGKSGTHTWSVEAKNKKSEAMKGENNPMWGKPRPDDVRKKISESSMGKIIPNEVRQKISKKNIGLFSGKNNPFFGKKHTEESLNLISLHSSGRNNPKYTSDIIAVNQETGEILSATSTIKMGELLNVAHTTVLVRINKNHPKHKKTLIKGIWLVYYETENNK